MGHSTRGSPCSVYYWPYGVRMLLDDSCNLSRSSSPLFPRSRVSTWGISINLRPLVASRRRLLGLRQAQVGIRQGRQDERENKAGGSRSGGLGLLALDSRENLAESATLAFLPR